jgi:hypothetical protein
LRFNANESIAHGYFYVNKQVWFLAPQDHNLVSLRSVGLRKPIQDHNLVSLRSVGLRKPIQDHNLVSLRSVRLRKPIQDHNLVSLSSVRLRKPIQDHNLVSFCSLRLSKLLLTLCFYALTRLGLFPGLPYRTSKLLESVSSRLPAGSFPK